MEPIVPTSKRPLRGSFEDLISLNGTAVVTLTTISSELYDGWKHEDCDFRQPGVYKDDDWCFTIVIDADKSGYMPIEYIESAIHKLNSKFDEDFKLYMSFLTDKG